MRIAVVGHSLIHIRQRRFFAQVAHLGHDVLVVCPNRWATLECTRSTESGPGWSYTIEPLPAPGEPDMYRFGLLGLAKALADFHPDVVYVQEEVGATLTRQALDLAKQLGAARALFVWENQQAPTPEQDEELRQLDLLVCGNDAASRLHSAAPTWCVLPQVGVDTDHFQARPDVLRTKDVMFVGRLLPEKGVEYLRSAWPTAEIPPWRDWSELPWTLSQARVVVTYSQDTPHWREQAMPYMAVEAMACGCAVVASQAGAIPWWLGGGYTLECPGATLVPQGNAEALREAIRQTLERWEPMGQEGREWVVRYLSSPVIASALMEQFNLLVEARRSQ